MQQRSWIEVASEVAAAGLLTWALLGLVGAGRAQAASPPVASAPKVPAAERAPAASPPATAPASEAGAAATGSSKPATGRDLADTLLGDERFATLAQALRTAGLLPLLKSKGPYTLFAPTQEAWKKLPAGMLDDLLAQPARLKALLSYHIIRGRVDNVGLHKLRNALTMGGIVLIDYTSGVKINGAVVTGADLGCRNGIIHAIDKVLQPSDRKRPGPAVGKSAAARKPAPPPAAP